MFMACSGLLWHVLLTSLRVGAKRGYCSLSVCVYVCLSALNVINLPARGHEARLL